MHIPTAEEIEARARAKSLSIAAMCRLAKVDPSAFYRYKQGKAVTVDTVRRIIDAVEAAAQP